LVRRATSRGTIAHARVFEGRRARAGLKPRAWIMRQCRWWPVGPRNVNGRVRCLAIHQNGQPRYAGSADGGVWKSTDAGQRWTATMDRLASLSIGALALDPAQPDTIYAGTGEPLYVPVLTDYAWSFPGAGVYRSVDGGQTWTTFGSVQNQFIYRVAVDPNDPTNLLCAGFSFPAGSGGLCRWQAGW